MNAAFYKSCAGEKWPKCAFDVIAGIRQNKLISKQLRNCFDLLCSEVLFLRAKRENR